MQGSFVDKLLDLMPRLVTSKPSEVVKILQTTLRQSTFLHLPLPERVSLMQRIKMPIALQAVFSFQIVPNSP